jgi:hypothetical protein
MPASNKTLTHAMQRFIDDPSRRIVESVWDTNVSSSRRTDDLDEQSRMIRTAGQDDPIDPQREPALAQGLERASGQAPGGPAKKRER